MLYIPMKVGLYVMLLLSSSNMQNCNQDLLYSSFKKGFIAFEWHLITLDFKRQNNDVLFEFNEYAKDLVVVC